MKHDDLTRRSFLKTFVAIGLAGTTPVCLAGKKVKGASKPNIILVMTLQAEACIPALEF